MNARSTPSWAYLGPGLLLNVISSALVANSNQDWMRMTSVVAAAVAIMLIGVRLNLQAPPNAAARVGDTPASLLLPPV
jgi:hypothetical protein